MIFKGQFLTFISLALKDKEVKKVYFEKLRFCSDSKFILVYDY